MSVIDRLNRLVRANLNHLAARSSGRSVMGEVRDSLKEARAQLVECRLAEKRLTDEYEALLDQSQSWEDRALLALKGNDEPLARRALLRKHEIDRQARSLKNQLDNHRAYSTDLMRSLDAMEVKLQALRDRGRARASSAGSAEEWRGGQPAPTAPPTRPDGLARLEAEAELGGLGRSELFADFDDMSARLSRSEAELEALEALSGSGDWAAADDLEARFNALEANRNLDRLKGRAKDDLDDLKRRLNEE